MRTAVRKIALNGRDLRFVPLVRCLSTTRTRKSEAMITPSQGGGVYSLIDDIRKTYLPDDRFTRH